MLQMRDTRVQFSKHLPVASGHQVPEEGIALVYIKDADGTTKVMPSTGAAGEVFAGVSLSRNSAPAMLPNVENGVVPSGGVIQLARAPLPGQFMVKVDGNVLDNTKVTVSNDMVTFDSSLVGGAYTVQYIYAPTVVEARSVKGDAPVGGLASTALGIVGILQNSAFGTNFFDASCDWSGVLFAKLGPNGTFTAADASTGLKNVIVRNTPNSADPYLVLDINVA